MKFHLPQNLSSWSQNFQNVRDDLRAELLRYYFRLGGRTDLFFTEEKIPEVGTKIKDYPRVSYLWHLEFEVKSMGVQGPNYSNIVRVTNGDNYGAAGNRYPAIFVKQARSLIFKQETVRDGFIHRISQCPIKNFAKN